MSLLERAIQTAVEVHAGQIDKAGRPYILHPLAVMFAAERAYLPGVIVTLEEFMAAAVLHDAPEDHPTLCSLNYILSVFGENVHRIVDGVTRREGEIYLSQFIVRAAQDPGSRLLKGLDIDHNLGRIHLLPIGEQGIQRRYERAKAILDNPLSSF